MNESAQYAYKLLRSAAWFADQAAQQIVKMPEVPRTQLRRVVEAIASMSGVLTHLSSCGIEKHPLPGIELRPGKGSLPAYGPDNPIPAHIRANIEMSQALDILESFSAPGSNPVLAEIAERECARLRNELERG